MEILFCLIKKNVGIQFNDDGTANVFIDSFQEEKSGVEIVSQSGGKSNDHGLS